MVESVEFARGLDGHYVLGLLDGADEAALARRRRAYGAGIGFGIGPADRAEGNGSLELAYLVGEGIGKGRVGLEQVVGHPEGALAPYAREPREQARPARPMPSLQAPEHARREGHAPHARGELGLNGLLDLGRGVVIGAAHEVLEEGRVARGYGLRRDRAGEHLEGAVEGNRAPCRRPSCRPLPSARSSRGARSSWPA